MIKMAYFSRYLLIFCVLSLDKALCSWYLVVSMLIHLWYNITTTDKEEYMFGSKQKMKLVDFDQNVHMPRHIADKLNDLFFILLVLKKGEEKNIPTTTGVLIKTLFKTKIDSEVKFFNTGFYLYNKGPFNKCFYTYIDELSSVGIVQKDGYNLSLTTKGLTLIQPIIEEVSGLDDRTYGSIQKLVENNIEDCKDFDKIVDTLHETEIIDTKQQAVKMKDRIKSGIYISDSYVERTEDVKGEYRLPSRVLNMMLDLEAGVSQKDQTEVATYGSVKELLSAISND